MKTAQAHRRVRGDGGKTMRALNERREGLVFYGKATTTGQGLKCTRCGLRKDPSAYKDLDMVCRKCRAEE